LRSVHRSTTTSCGWWLARKDSNVRSPDPESGARIRPRKPPFEREAGLRRPPNRGESGAHPEMSQMSIPKTERVCCPIWATPILPPLAPRPNRPAERQGPEGERIEPVGARFIGGQGCRAGEGRQLSRQVNAGRRAFRHALSCTGSRSSDRVRNSCRRSSTLATPARSGHPAGSGQHNRPGIDAGGLWA
jgi:hypothetical protein